MKLVVLGFTGTQRGMTPPQAVAASAVMKDVNPYVFVHGDCIGSDQQAHDIAVSLKVRTRIRPCTIENKRAYCQADEVFEARPPLDRNKAIVSDASAMMATPGEFEEQLRSGTWATIRYARKAKKPLVIVYPDGSISRERWPGESDPPATSGSGTSPQMSLFGVKR